MEELTERTKLFSVIHFLSDDSVEAVPTKWISTDKKNCPWPESPPQNLWKLLCKADSQPESSWTRFPVELIKTYDLYSKAKAKAQRYALKSDAESSDCRSRKNVRSTNHRTFANTENRDPFQIIPENAPNIFEGTRKRVLEVNETISNKIPRPNENQQSEVSNLSDFIVLPSQTLPGNESLSYEIYSDPTILQLQKEQREFQEVCLRNQEIVKSEPKDVKRLLLQVLGCQMSTLNSSSSVSSFPHLPINEADELNALEEWLNIPENYNSFVVALSRIGGSSVSKTVYNILNYMFCHKFALSVRYTSSSGKIAFGNLNSAKVVRGAVLQTFNADKITNDDINKYIAKWFRESSSRQGGRKLKSKLQNNGDPSQNTEEEDRPDSEGNIEQNPQ